MIFNNKIRFKIGKLRLKLKQKLSVKYIPNEREEKVIEIVKALIKDKSSVMFFAPLSRKRYIKNDIREVFFIMEDVHLTLASSKHSYYYDINVNATVAEMLKKNFDNVLEKRKNVMEKEMITGVKSNLDFIAKHMNDQK